MSAARRRAIGLADVAAVAAIAAFAIPGPAAAAPPAATHGPRGGPAELPADSTSAETRLRLARESDENARRFGLAPDAAAGTPAFAWPLVPAAVGDFAIHGFASFVDQDPDIGEVLDYFCGARTYDTTAPYNHQGTDIFPWPYGWLRMDQDRVRIAAAAPGTIVAKDDGHFDRNCSCLTDDPNYVILQHADGSRSWYLHMKNGSVTSKPVGGSVVAGEILGTVGSSGCSSGVHLHFEVHDAGADPGAVLDPFSGACNSMNPSSLWIDQPPYRDPTVNRLSSHSEPPGLPACPTTEVPHEKRIFAPGDDVYLVVWLHDEGPSFPKTVRVFRPDQSEFYSEQHAAPDVYDASLWYWWWVNGDLTDGPRGRWTWQATIDGVTRSRAFWVDAIFADDFEDANLDAWSGATP